jgi:hypothetical protein
VQCYCTLALSKIGRYNLKLPEAIPVNQFSDSDNMSTAYAWEQEIVELYCVVCGNQILLSGHSCPNCRTPVAVSKSVAKQDPRKKSKLFSVLGASGAGKTVYLGMLLDMLGKGTHGLRGIPNGSFSMAVQDQTISALENRRFPEKTPSESDLWNWIHCEAFHQHRDKLRLDLVTPDVAGEVLAQEIEHVGSSATITHLAMFSDSIMILLDSTSIRDESSAEDSFAIKLVDYIARQQTKVHDERRGKVRLPIAFVLTKTDICPEAEYSTLQFAQTNLPGLYEFCRRHYQSFEFFPASVVGTTWTDFDEDGNCVSVPLHVQPRGIIEPLQWALGKLEKKWRNIT